MESVATLMAQARRAHEQEREKAPALLLKAVQQRVREICPEEDPWDAVRRMAKDQGDSAIRSTYGYVQSIANDQQRNLPYDDESWETNTDMADILIETLDKCYGNGPRGLQMESVATLLAKARRAHEQEREKAPALLLKAVQQRVREICPDEDPWDAVQRMAQEKDDLAIDGAYWYVMSIENDQQRNLPYDDESWEINTDMADILIEKLDGYYG